MAVAMWQATNWQRQTRERRGHAFKGVVVVVRDATCKNWSPAAEPFLTSQPSHGCLPAHALFWRQSQPGVAWEHHTSIRHYQDGNRALQSYITDLDDIWTSSSITSIAQPVSDEMP